MTITYRGQVVRVETERELLAVLWFFQGGA